MGEGEERGTSGWLKLGAAGYYCFASMTVQFANKVHCFLVLLNLFISHGLPQYCGSNSCQFKASFSDLYDCHNAPGLKCSEYVQRPLPKILKFAQNPSSTVLSLKDFECVSTRFTSKGFLKPIHQISSKHTSYFASLPQYLLKDTNLHQGAIITEICILQALFTIYNFHFPLTVTLLQMMVIAPVSYIVAKPKLDWSLARTFIPLSMVNVLNAVCGLMGKISLDLPLILSLPF